MLDDDSPSGRCELHLFKLLVIRIPLSPKKYRISLLFGVTLQNLMLLTFLNLKAEIIDTFLV